jgi:transcriptional repressor NrdR
MYCGASLQVANSRPQKRTNQVWRRRRCPSCGAVFTSTERLNYDDAIAVRRGTSLEPFSRDRLLISIYKSCQHRDSAASDASALAATVTAELQKTKLASGVLALGDIIQTTSAVLARFDHAASVQYQAFHRLP